METNLLLGVPLNSFYFYLVVFSATLGQYNIHYFIKDTANTNSDRFLWSETHRQWHLLLNVAGALGLIIGLLHLNVRHFMVLGIVMLITVLYSFPFLPFRKKKRLKDFGLLKILTLTYVWTLITVWFPLANLTRITSDFQLVFAHRFVFMFALCLAFDIRDMEADGQEGIRTIPVKFGKKWSYIGIYLSLLVFVALSVFYFKRSLDFMSLNAMILSAIATYFVVEYSKSRQTDMVYLAGIDGMMLLQAILIGIGRL